MRTPVLRALVALVVALVLASACVDAKTRAPRAPKEAPRPSRAPEVTAPSTTGASGGCGFFYGTYSVGPKDGKVDKETVATRLQELQRLGANMVVATGTKTKVLDLLPKGMLAVPGCGLMKKKDWQEDGKWSEAHAREKLAKLAEKFANHPRVYGVCLTHEVTEYADHARRRWMYQLAKQYFPSKKVIQYYGTVYDRLGAGGDKQYSYGENGEVETDVFFVSLPAVGKEGRFTPDKAKRLDVILESAARVPEVPVWGQTSINADHKYVHGAQSMYDIWGQRGENMAPWVESLLRLERRDAHGRPVRLSGFFWRSLGRFPYDLGYPEFTAHREQVRRIAANVCRMRQQGRAAAPTSGDATTTASAPGNATSTATAPGDTQGAR
jgi:hypothetical protein